MAYRGSSSSGAGSRYPSAYGHTPSYRSYNSLGSSTSTGYDLPSSSAYKSDLARDLAREHKTVGFSDTDKFFSDVDRAFDTPLTTGGTSSSSSKKVSSYSSSYSSTSGSGAGGRPVVEYSTDSSYKSSNTGASGIPHSSYAHTSSSYSSDNPYKNRVSSYSYNI